MRTDSIGKNNPKLIEIRKAIRAGSLTRDGLLPVEGRKLIDEAARSGLDVVDVFVREDQDPDGVPGQRRHIVDAAVFKSIQSTQTSQGVIALVRPRSFEIDELVRHPHCLLIVLARLQDPGNVGTILRVGESFGATGCIALEGTASPYNPKTVRASAGSLFRLPQVWNRPTSDLGRLKAAGIHVIGAVPEGETPPEACDWRKPSALLIGNEGGGLTPEEIAFCDVVVGIRQNRAVESLNSAIAAAILLYEASKRRP